MKKIYKGDNYVIVEKSGRVHPLSMSNSEYDEKFDKFTVGKLSTKRKISIPFAEVAEWENELGVAYTIASLRSFLRTSTSFKKGGGTGGGGGTGTDDQTAAEVTYDGATSGLTASNAQAAIDEVKLLADSGSAAPVASDADILTGSLEVPSLFTAKQINNETIRLAQEITPVFWDASYNGYGDQSVTLGGRKYAIGSDGRTYIAQVNNVPSGTDPVTDDGTNWLYKGTATDAPIEVANDAWFPTSSTGFLIDVTPAQWASNPEITLKAKDIDTGEVVDVTVPANSTFSPSGFYGGDAVFISAPSAVTLAVVKRPSNKFQLTYIDQDDASAGNYGDISDIRLDGTPVDLMISTIDEYVSKKIADESVTKIISVGTSRELNNSDNGNILIVTADATLTIPEGLMLSFNCAIYTKAGILTNATDPIITEFPLTGSTLAENKTQVIMQDPTDANNYIITGDNE